jgi:predicted DNA-binding transcriptional regulator AlpA
MVWLWAPARCAVTLAPMPTNHRMGPQVTAPQNASTPTDASAAALTLQSKTKSNSARPPLPEAHADVALVDIKDVCALIRMSSSWVHDEVRARRFPQPLRYGPRCTRWTMASIRAWLVERAAQPQGAAAEQVVARAKKASAAAQAKRARIASVGIAE